MIRWSEVSVRLAARFQRRLTNDAGIEQVSHGLQVRKFCNHLVELHLLFGSKRSPSVLDLIIISILKPGKPAGSARVLICNRCHHKLIIFTRCKDTKKIWYLPYFEPLFFNFCILLGRSLGRSGDSASRVWRWLQIRGLCYSEAWPPVGVFYSSSWGLLDLVVVTGDSSCHINLKPQ